MSHSVVVLSGGIGGAKLCLGFYRIMAPEKLAVIVNTGDDFHHLGLPICPDIDTALYTLGEVSNKELGWGREDESWAFFETLAALGGEDWFRLGDRDLALHVMRQHLLGQGKSLTQVTQFLARKLGVAAKIIPMSDDRVSTQVISSEGELPFQHYFVRRRCEPEVKQIYFQGGEQALVAPAAREVLSSPDLGAIVIAPSNPYLSIAPILAVPGMRELLAAAKAPVIAVSPVIGGVAVKGPTVKIMAELGLSPSAASVAQAYDGLLDGFVLDTTDAELARSLPVSCKVTNTLMNSLHDREQLARDVLAFAEELG